MADNEVSKITWIAIVVALAGSIYGVSKTQIPALAASSFAKVSELVGTSDTNNTGSETAPVAEKPDSNDAKWVQKGNYGDNGYFVRDADGKGIVYALDNSKPILAPETAVFTKGNANLTSLTFLDKTILPKNSSNYFADNSKLTTFETKNLDTAKVTNMSGMFVNMTALTTLDVSKFDTSEVTNMNSMFSGMWGLTTLDVSNFDTSNVTGMSGMFDTTSALTALDVSNFDTSNVTGMSGMFGGMEALTALDVSNFDTSNVTDMNYMFYNVNALTSLDVSKFNTSNVTNMKGMFRKMNVLTSLDISNFNTSKVTNMGYMFGNTTQLQTLDISNFNMTNVADASNMFIGSMPDLKTVRAQNTIPGEKASSADAFDSSIMSVESKAILSKALFTK